MNKKYTNSLIASIITQHKNGYSVASLCAEHNIPRSTIYFWLKQHRTLKSSTGAEISYKDYHNLQRRYAKLEEILKIIKASGCGLSAPLEEKLTALEKLYGQYSVYALCDALEVSRGTFYNHIFRRRKITEYDLRREELRQEIKEVFDESKQRFGAGKIRAVLVERGTKVSDRYVSELMQEMGLQSIGRNSKREYQKQITRNKRSNRLQQQFNVSEPNKVWVSDTTCFKVENKYYYICIVLDLFFRKIIAYRISPKHSTYLITSTVRRALKERNHPQNLTFHSD